MNEKSIKIEVSVDESGHQMVSLESIRNTLVDISLEDFNKIGNIIEFASQSLAKRTENMENKPTAYSVAFGINAGGEVGVPFITKGTVGANFTVILNWDK